MVVRYVPVISDYVRMVESSHSGNFVLPVFVLNMFECDLTIVKLVKPLVNITIAAPVDVLPPVDSQLL